MLKNYSEYDCIQIEDNTSMRDTTPFVTEMVSPPRGYPTTVTESCSRFIFTQVMH